MKEQLEEEVLGADQRIQEINAELQSIVEQLGEAKLDKHENTRYQKKRELIDNLKRLFTGVVSSFNCSN